VLCQPFARLISSPLAENYVYVSVSVFVNEYVILSFLNHFRFH